MTTKPSDWSIAESVGFLGISLLLLAVTGFLIYRLIGLING